MFCTSFGYDDNNPPSAYITFPKDKGYPTVHSHATEGTGEYSSPITMAADEFMIPIGSYVYNPYLRKYFIMEDDCPPCDGEWHMDQWMGPQYLTLPIDKLLECERYITNTNIVIINPPTNLIVDTTPLINNQTGECTANLYNSSQLIYVQENS